MSSKKNRSAKRYDQRVQHFYNRLFHAPRFTFAELQQMRTGPGLYCVWYKRFRPVDFGCTVCLSPNAITGRAKEKFGKIAEHPVFDPADFTISFVLFPAAQRHEALGIEGALNERYEPSFAGTGFGSNVPGRRRNPVPSKFWQLTEVPINKAA